MKGSITEAVQPTEQQALKRGGQQRAMCRRTCVRFGPRDGSHPRRTRHPSGAQTLLRSCRRCLLPLRPTAEEDE